MPEDKKAIRHAPVACYYAAGGVFLLYALLFPFYRIVHYLVAICLSVLAWVVCARIFPADVEEVRQAPKPTGDAVADDAISEGMARLDELTAIGKATDSPAVKSSITSIADTVRKILSAIKEKPSKAPMVRRLMSYYLPTLIKLTSFYERIEEQGGEGENVVESKKRIEGNLRQLDAALKKQLDLLYEDDALDISTDITVMENMLAQEGLSGGIEEESKTAKGE